MQEQLIGICNFQIAESTGRLWIVILALVGLASGCHRQNSAEGPGAEEPNADRSHVGQTAAGTNFESLLTQGDAFNLQGDAAGAIPYYARAIQLEPQRAEGYAKRAAALSSAGSSVAAVADFDRAIQRAPSDPELYLNRAQLQLVLKRSESALADCDIAIRLNPKLAMARLYRANIHIARGEFDAAIQDCDAALVILPNLPSAYNNRGVAYRSKGDLAHALADYTLAMHYDTSFADACNNRGEIYLHQGEYEKALADFTEALRINPAKIEAYDHRGDLHLLLGQTELAIADYSAIIERTLQTAARNKSLHPGPKLAKVYLKRAAADVKAGRPKVAITDIGKAISLDPDDPRAYSLRGEAYAQLGQSDLAKADAELVKRMEQFQRQHAHAP